MLITLMSSSCYVIVSRSYIPVFIMNDNIIHRDSLYVVWCSHYVISLVLRYHSYSYRALAFVVCNTISYVTLLLYLCSTNLFVYVYMIIRILLYKVVVYSHIMIIVHCCVYSRYRGFLFCDGKDLASTDHIPFKVYHMCLFDTSNQ